MVYSCCLKSEVFSDRRCVMIKVPYIYGSMTALSESERVGMRKFCEQLSELCRSYVGGSFAHHEHYKVPTTELTPEQSDLLIRRRLGQETSLFVAVAGDYSFDFGVMCEMAYRSDVPIVLINHHFRFYSGSMPKLLAGNPGIMHRIAYEQYDDALSKFKDYLISNWT